MPSGMIKLTHHDHSSFKSARENYYYLHGYLRDDNFPSAVYCNFRIFYHNNKIGSDSFTM